MSEIISNIKKYFYVGFSNIQFQIFQILDVSEYFDHVGQKVVEKERPLEEFYHTKMLEDMA